MKTATCIMCKSLFVVDDTDDEYRMKSGLGSKPMLSELADAIGDLRAKVERLERVTRLRDGLRTKPRVGE